MAVVADFNLFQDAGDSQLRLATMAHGAAVCSQDSPDVWSMVECGQLEVGGVADLDLLLPNGFLVNMRCPMDSTLAALKQDLFVQAKKLPLYDRLLAPSDYIFYTIGTNGEREELYDESRCIFSLRLFVPLLSLIEPEGNREEKELAHDIGLAIGHPLSEIEAKLSPEEMSYRMDLYRVMEQAVASRGVTGYSHYAFPEELCSETDADIHPELKAKIQMADLYIELWYRSREDELANIDSNCICVKIRKVIDVHTSDVIASAIKELTLRHKLMALWELEGNLKLRVHSASHLTITDIDKIYVRAALYHGMDLIANEESAWVLPSNPRWGDGWINFDVCLKDLAPAVQLCLSLVAVKQKKKEEHSGLGWVNIRLFNWNSEIIQGKNMFYLWPFPQYCAELINPSGQ
ncbi:unnamed protein product, partial [Gongylonema pulchrum]|uniref:Sister chromatid cohesion protein DCC1 n=1 Tax=Gongylonema pulchrum TaxID=637853 RepID=A0A183E1P3_9BILA